MHKLTLVAFLMLITPLSFADSSQSQMPWPSYPKLNRIHYQASVEQWVTTSTALVTIGIDASQNQKGMDTLQEQVDDSLATLTKNVTWQMTDYERTEDASGLEQIHMEEQARLNTNQLIDMRSKTYNLSKPGIKYSIINIEFTPSLAELQAAQDSLRAELYTKIKQELDLVDKTYAQDFYIHNITFTQGNAPMPVPMAQNGGNYKMLAVAGAVQPQATMSQKVVMTADVILASTIAVK
ncbi:MAG: hypothetical protein HKM04_08860 [Legionellales bacterium]|nr:hypothetical protein [Legionellales bacterium]